MQFLTSLREEQSGAQRSGETCPSYLAGESLRAGAAPGVQPLTMTLRFLPMRTSFLGLLFSNKKENILSGENDGLER